MRTFVILTLALLLLACTAVAQQSTSAFATDPIKRLPVDRDNTKLAFTGNPIQHRQLDSAAFDSLNSPEQNTCWFIRSYIFERHDGEAPVLTGETVCTSSKANTLRRTRKSGAKFVPLAW